MNDSPAGFSISLLGYSSTAAFNDRHRGAPRASRQKARNDADQDAKSARDVSIDSLTADLWSDSPAVRLECHGTRRDDCVAPETRVDPATRIHTDLSLDCGQILNASVSDSELRYLRERPSKSRDATNLETYCLGVRNDYSRSGE